MTDQINKGNTAPSTEVDNTAQADNSEQPNYITVEQMNAAITARNRDLIKEVTNLKDLLNRLAPANPTSTEEKPDNSNKAKIQELEKQVADMRKAKEAEVQKRMDMELRDAVKGELTALGIKPGLLKAAMATLIDADQTIGYSEEGNLVFRDRVNGEMDLMSGLKQWVKSAEAREFLMPKGSKGSGDRNYTSNKSTGSTEQEAMDTVINALTTGRY